MIIIASNSSRPKNRVRPWSTFFLSVRAYKNPPRAGWENKTPPFGGVKTSSAIG
ncbi:hypothetical protein [Trueperella bialowiezensis]|uniref:hypothetical protein n=1 Tax=Trueperella bialowiezensis TaxID=312285 RepID=UPI0013DEC49C|nr:hypothetical protein [Trueperella bialowiezensis]